MLFFTCTSCFSRWCNLCHAVKCCYSPVSFVVVSWPGSPWCCSLPVLSVPLVDVDVLVYLDQDLHDVVPYLSCLFLLLMYIGLSILTRISMMLSLSCLACSSCWCRWSCLSWSGSPWCCSSPILSVPLVDVDWLVFLDQDVDDVVPHLSCLFFLFMWIVLSILTRMSMMLFLTCPVCSSCWCRWACLSWPGSPWCCSLPAPAPCPGPRG